jgi:hypothetical protein
VGWFAGRIDLSGMSAMNVAKEANMPYKRWKLLLSFWAISFAFTLFTSAPEATRK